MLFAPKGTPGAIVARVSAEVSKVLSEPASKDRAAGFDVVTLGGTPEHALSTLRAAAGKWGPVVKRIGLALD